MMDFWQDQKFVMTEIQLLLLNARMIALALIRAGIAMEVHNFQLLIVK